VLNHGNAHNIVIKVVYDTIKHNNRLKRGANLAYLFALGCHSFNNKAFETTLKLLNAMAAPATIGSAASGTPFTLETFARSPFTKAILN
jgi:hypothetical protein